MEKEEFKALSIKEQINYSNENFKNGKSLNETTKTLGISKNISEKFKRNGYILKDIYGVKQYIEDLVESSYEDIGIKQKKLPKVVATIEKEIEEASSASEKRSPGRPKKYNLTKHNVTIDDDAWKQLAVYALLNNTTSSESFNKMIDKFLKENNINYNL